MLLLRPDLVDMSKVPSDGPAQFPHMTAIPSPKVSALLPAFLPVPKAPPPKRASFS